VSRIEPHRRLQFVNLTRQSPLPLGELGVLGELVLRHNRPQKGWQVRIILVPESEIISLNRRFFKRDNSTDVISFNLTPADSELLEGEVYICLDTANRQAQEYGVTLAEEMQRLTAHGLYHLLGYEDGDAAQKQIMTALEDDAMARLRAYSRGERPV
jgi:probable rRNA maturation factor